MKLTKWEMFLALANQISILHNGVGVLIQSIEREDGSGHCYNLMVREMSSNKKYSVFCRTTD